MITDYSTLKTAIGNWLARADLSAAIPEFIQLTESAVNRQLFVRERMTEVTGESASGLIALPDDFDTMISLRVTDGQVKRAIHPVTVDHDSAYVGTARSYTTVGSNLRLIGTDDADYTLTYYARIPSLSDSNSQNWLLAKEPGVYLYGALLEAAPYLKDDNRLSVWGAKFAALLDDLRMKDDKARYGNAPRAEVDFNAP